MDREDILKSRGDETRILGEEEGRERERERERKQRRPKEKRNVCMLREQMHAAAGEGGENGLGSRIADSVHYVDNCPQQASIMYSR